jgi:single-strand DNA-binding protein
MSDVNVTVVGHVGQDPTLFTADSGTRWTSIRVASTRRVRDARTGEWGDGPTMWFTVRAFGERALNVVGSVRKGTPVVVTGRLAFEEYEVRKEDRRPDGGTQEVTELRHAMVVENASVAVDVSRGVAVYTRRVHSGSDPWALPGAEPAPAASSDGGEPTDGPEPADGDAPGGAERESDARPEAAREALPV